MTNRIKFVRGSVQLSIPLNILWEGRRGKRPFSQVSSAIFSTHCAQENLFSPKPKYFSNLHPPPTISIYLPLSIRHCWFDFSLVRLFLFPVVNRLHRANCARGKNSSSTTCLVVSSTIYESRVLYQVRSVLVRVQTRSSLSKFFPIESNRF